MVLLSRTARRIAARAVPWVTIALGITACVMLEPSDPTEGRPRFPHAIHAEEGIDCTDCHPGAEDGDEPGMPARATCQLCHADLDEEKPEEQRADVFFPEGKLVASHWSELGTEVRFSHAGHAAAVQDCEACHTGITQGDRVRPEVAVTMDECMDCHATRSVSNDCATCHAEIGPEWTPESHRHEWKLLHGQVVRRGTSDAIADRCVLCHTESSCNACHRDEPPASHTNFFRLRGHGTAAAIDRQNCAACHRSDSCERCHSETLPQSHKGSWGSGPQTHCLSCHLPLQGEGCLVCHRSTPGHALAAPQPPDHTPGMNCRQCHGVTQPLPHVDNGDNCNICHR